MLVANVMSEDPFWVDEEATVGEAARKLDEAAVRHLPVLRDGVVVGIVSDRDLRSVLAPLDALTRHTPEVTARLQTPIKEVMTTRVAAVEPDRDLRDVVDKMLEYQIGAVVVIDPGSWKLVGIVSYVDVLRAVRDLVWG